MPWIVSDEVMICSSHQILEAGGKRESLHGHNWRVRVFLEAAELDKRGLVADFNEVKAIVWEAVEVWDHRHLNDLDDFQDVEPTAEQLARIACNRLGERLDDGRIRVDRVEVWMTDKGCATYSR